MSIDENSFEEILQEQLELSGVLVDEAEEDDEPEDQYDILRNAKGVEKEEEKPKEDKEEKDDEPEEELADEWEINVKTSSKFKFEMHENYIYVWYRQRRSQKIPIPPRLRQTRELMSKLFNDMLSHVEKVS
jgi:hypothetical protein